MAVREKRNEVIVGLFVFVGLAFLGGLILQFGRFGDRFRSHYPLSVVFTDASGLIKGSEVRMGGAKIGKVALRPELNEKLKVQVELMIDDRVKIPSGSEFRIESSTLLGDKMVVITPPEAGDGTFIPPGSLLPGGGPSGLEALQENVVEFSKDAREMMVQAGRALENLDGAVTDIRSATDGLRDMIGKINGEVLSDQNLGSFNRSVGSLEEMLATLNDSSKDLSPMIADAREAIGSIREAADGARSTLAGVDEKVESLGPALEEMPGAVRSLSQAADKAGKALESVEEGDGLLGTLAYDREVSSDAKVFIGNLRRYGILRYRDEESADERDPRNRFRGRRR